MKDFDLFKKTFVKYQKLFGLTGYKVYFKHEPIGDDCFADITVSQDMMVASVRLNSVVYEFRDVERSAKHEAIHLLLNRLQNLAEDRYARAIQINEAAEEIVFKLEDLIKD